MGEGTDAFLLGAGRTDPLGTRLGKGVMYKVYRVQLHTYLMKMGTGTYAISLRGRVTAVLRSWL